MKTLAVSLIGIGLAWSQAAGAQQQLTQPTVDGRFIIATPGQPSVVRPNLGGYTITVPEHNTITTSGRQTITTWGDRSVVTTAQQSATTTHASPPPAAAVEENSWGR